MIWPDISWSLWRNRYVLAALVPCTILLLVHLVRMRRAVRALVDARWQSMLLSGCSMARLVAKATLLFLGTAALCVALIGPQWGEREEVIEQEGRDLFIALDLSRSMLAEDITPTRLACAKEKIETLLRILSCERVGLITFAGQAYVMCPLTSDYGAFKMFLQQADVDTGTSGTTAIDSAIKAALKVFQRTPGRKSKLLVIFTDGEDFSPDLAGIRQQAADAGLSLFTIGVATADGAPVPVLNLEGHKMGYQKDAKGELVISRLQADLMRSLAEQTGGRYIPLTRDTVDMQTLVAAVQQFERERMQDKKIRSYEQRYPYAAGVSFLSFLIEWVI